MKEPLHSSSITKELQPTVPHMVQAMYSTVNNREPVVPPGRHACGGLTGDRNLPELHGPCDANTLEVREEWSQKRANRVFSEEIMASS